MINEIPKLVELAYSQTRVYQSQELRQLMVAIRKWESQTEHIGEYNMSDTSAASRHEKEGKRCQENR